MQFRIKILSLLAAFALSFAPAVAAPGYDGRPVEVAQSDRSRGAPVVTGMAFLNGKTSFLPGETVRVVLNGTPGGRAWFAISGVTNQIPMTEVASGRYEGSFMVQEGMQATNGRLEGGLALRGRSVQYVERGGVDIGYQPGTGTPPYSTGPYSTGPYSTGPYSTGPYSTGPYSTGPYSSGPYYPGTGYGPGQLYVNVTSPMSGQMVPPDFTVTGQTVPGAQVHVTARLTRNIAGVINVGTETARGAGMAGANGFFAIPMHLGGRGNVLGSVVTGGVGNIELKVVATDPRTSASREVQFNIATGGY